MNTPRYPKYRDSGIEWLGQIPSHWAVKRLKHICCAFPSNVDKKSYENEERVRLCNYVDVYYNEQITSEIPFMEATASQDQIIKFALKCGDIIITKDSETADDIAVASYVPDDLPGVLCGYHLSIVRPLRDTSGCYVKRLFDSRFLKAQFEVAANGLTRVGLSQYAVDNVLVTVPPATEQTAIARYLDAQSKKIDALIEEQQKLIRLLREKRQAIISHAVTKGLDPTVPMKDSGIEWLGSIPQHWRLVPLKRLVEPGRRITYGIVQPGEIDPQGRYMIRGQDYSSEWAEPSNVFRVSSAIEEPYRRARLKAGDIVMTIVGAGIGNVAVVPDRFDGANITQTTARIAPNLDLVMGDHLFQVLRSAVGRYQVGLYQKGAAQPGLNLEHLVSFAIPVPDLKEQKRITVFLAGKIEVFSKLVAQSQRAITLLKEYRSALISAAVTGKINVQKLMETEPPAKALEPA